MEAASFPVLFLLMAHHPKFWTNVAVKVEAELLCLCLLQRTAASIVLSLLLPQVALGTVTNVDEAVQWLSYTYLHIRMMHNPQAYGIPLARKEVSSAMFLVVRGQ